MDFETTMAGDQALGPRRFLGVSLKMYFDHLETLAWTRAVADVVTARHSQLGALDVIVLPSFPSLGAVAQIVGPTPIQLGAQDLAAQPEGAFTGEVSGRSLVQVGCQYVEIGHAERRDLFGEDDAVIGAKLAAAWQVGLIPIFCLGEAADAGRQAAVAECRRQAEAALTIAAADGGPGQIVLAYEPVWAIGGDEPAAASYIAAVCGGLRDFMAGNYPGLVSRVVYGGSAGPGLVTQLGDAVDGLFLGRFAHDPASFARVLDETIAQVAGRVEVS